MFDLLLKEQEDIYNYLNKQIINEKLSHAYLVDVGLCANYEKIILDIVKMIVCSQYDNLSNKKNICSRIESGNYPEISIIKPDGMWIKKEQMIELQNQFSTISVEGRYRIYVIFDCDKMNKQTSNSILKFLEEPAENIIAILATRNSNKMLKTITSRCQFLKLKSNFEFENLELCDDLDKKVHEFINYVEKFNYDTIIYTKELWFQYFSDKDAAEQAISRMIYFYYNKLKESCKMKESSNIIIDIIRKIEILVETKNAIKYNLNLNLLVDKMIMDLVGDNNESSFN